MFVGCSISTKHYIVSNPLAKTLHWSGDVILREGNRYTVPNAADQSILNELFYRDVGEEPKPIEMQPTEGQTEESLHDNPPPEPLKPKKQSWELACVETLLEDTWEPPAKGSRQNRPGKVTVAETAQLGLEGEQFEDMILIHVTAAISDDHDEGMDDPKSYKAATKSRLTEKWDTAMKSWLDAIVQHQVFGDVMDLPEGRKAVPSHSVKKTKHDGPVYVQQFKARQVCGENHQIMGIDYQATYAPTTHLGHVRVALAITTTYDVEIHQMDVCTAFLGVAFEDEISKHLPQGYFCFIQAGSWYNDPRLKTLWKMVLRLQQCLCGLKQSSHIWYATLMDLVISIVFVAECVDGGLFMLEDQGIVSVVVVWYVNDLLMITNEGLIGKINDPMKMSFWLQSPGSVLFYLGMNIEHTRELHAMNIHLHSYIWSILAKIKIDVARPHAM